MKELAHLALLGEGMAQGRAQKAEQEVKAKEPVADYDKVNR